MTLWELLRDALPGLAVLNSIVATVVVWAVRRASKDDLAKAAARADNGLHEAAKHRVELEQRLSGVEGLAKLLPTRNELHALQIEMTKAGGRIRAAAGETKRDRERITAEIQNSRMEFDRQHEATEKLLERTETQVRILMQHLLDRGN